MQKSFTLSSATVKSLFFLALLLVTLSSYAQTQKGGDINGSALNDGLGNSVSMPNANTIAVGAPTELGTQAPGSVKIYTWSGSAWVQKGSTLTGEAIGDRFGWKVSMPDVNTIAVGGVTNSGAAQYAGHARIFSWNGSAWVQKGADIDGLNTYDFFGASISMPDANTVAIGSQNNSNANADFAGHVRIYTWNGSSWVQKGTAIEGASDYDLLGSAVSMPDANTVGVGAPGDFTQGAQNGFAAVYTWSGSAWVQKGINIAGQSSESNGGYSVDMPDANNIAVGAIGYDANGTEAGQVRVFGWSGTAWVQRGADILGEAAGDHMGYSVSMPDANTLAVSAAQNDNNGTDAGQVSVYTWNGLGWVLKGTSIGGEAGGDNMGGAVSMPDANTIGIGAPKNDGGASDAGQARVYTFSSVGIQETLLSNISVYPNPTVEQVTIDLGQILNDVTVSVANTLGQEMSKQEFNTTARFTISINNEPGVYYVTVTSGSSALARTKVLKQ